MPDDKKIQTPDYDPENPRCDKKQLEFLKECIADDGKGYEKWNKWRNDENDEIWLQEADLVFRDINGFNFRIAHLEGANFMGSYLKGAYFARAHLEGTRLEGAHLENARFREAHLEGAKLMETHLEGAYIGATNLRGADFSRAIVDGETLVWVCPIDIDTKFEGVGLDNMRIYPLTKQTLEYNIRRMNWQTYCKYKDWDKIFPKEERKWLSRILLLLLIKGFWAISDYGRSTKRIVITFFGLALLFAIAYRLWPNCVWVNGEVGDIRGFVHALYFSVVTMTTLGFGDIAANPDSWQGQVLLMVQVILGYVLLGALVTRFAVLFTGGGPAGKLEKRFKKPQPALSKDEG